MEIALEQKPYIHGRPGLYVSILVLMEIALEPLPLPKSLISKNLRKLLNAPNSSNYIFLHT
jgi:hypothetical protein